MKVLSSTYTQSNVSSPEKFRFNNKPHEGRAMTDKFALRGKHWGLIMW